jgi:hypothetical protein
MQKIEYEDFGTSVPFPKAIDLTEPLRVRDLLLKSIELHKVSLDLKTINLRGREPTGCYKIRPPHRHSTRRGNDIPLPNNLVLKDAHAFFVLISLTEIGDYVAKLHEIEATRVEDVTLRTSTILQLVNIGEIVEK